jgi:DNA-binding MarR family transcriptional regulator
MSRRSAATAVAVVAAVATFHRTQDCEHPLAASVELDYLDEDGIGPFFSRLTRVSLYLDAFQHRCLDRFGLRFIDYSVLRVLYLSNAPYQMSPSRLAEVVVRSSGGMTQILDRLERAQLVARTNDPADRRKVIVGLTPQGLRLVRRANKDWTSQKKYLLGDLSPEEFAQMDNAIRVLLGRLHEDFHQHGGLERTLARSSANGDRP